MGAAAPAGARGPEVDHRVTAAAWPQSTPPAKPPPPSLVTAVRVAWCATLEALPTLGTDEDDGSAGSGSGALLRSMAGVVEIALQRQSDDGIRAATWKWCAAPRARAARLASLGIVAAAWDDATLRHLGVSRSQPVPVRPPPPAEGEVSAKRRRLLDPG